MAGSIFLILPDSGETERLVPLNEERYDSEERLQRLLADYPDLLAGDQIRPDAPRRWLLVARECPLPAEEDGGDRWSVDHLFLDQDGIPTIVEVKRSTDTRIRREVVGQMLDYAANAVLYWPVERLRAHFEDTCGENVNPDDQISEFLGPEGDPGNFWERVKTNLQAGNIRMIFVADQIPRELQRIIEFLNGQMDPAEVLGVELRQFTGERLRTMVPRVIGLTSQASEKKEGSRVPTRQRQWDEASFLEEIEKSDGTWARDLVLQIMKWAKEQGLYIGYGRSRSRSCYLCLGIKEKEYFIFAMWTGWTGGGIGFEKSRMIHTPPFDNPEKLKEFMARLNQIPGLRLPPDGSGAWPGQKFSILRDKSALDKFLAVYEWLITEIRAAAAQG